MAVTLSQHVHHVAFRQVMSCLARSNFRGTCVPSCGVVGLSAFSHFTVSTSSRCSGESRIQVPLRPSASLLLSSLARYTPRKPARCTVTSRHVSSPQFTYLIWWTVTLVSCLSPLQLSPLGLPLLVEPEQVTVTSRYITSSRSSRCCRHVTLSFSS